MLAAWRGVKYGGRSVEALAPGFGQHQQARLTMHYEGALLLAGPFKSPRETVAAEDWQAERVVPRD